MYLLTWGIWKKKTVCERRLRATHLDQSNYLPNLKQGEINKYNYTIENCSSHCSRVLPGSESCAFLQEQMRMRSGYHSIWLLHLIQDFQWMSVRVTYWTSLEMLRVCNTRPQTKRHNETQNLCLDSLGIITQMWLVITREISVGPLALSTKAIRILCLDSL